MFVNTAPAKCNPSVRCCTRLCELTSIKQYSHPRSTISAIIRLSRTLSGVVCVDSRRSESMQYVTVEIRPTL